MLPLYRSNSRLVLNYSERIPRGEYVHLSKEAPEQSAVEVARIISDDIPKLELIREPGYFLEYVGWMIGNERPTFLLDLGKPTYFLVGRSHEAVSVLGEIPAAIDKNISMYLSAGVRDLNISAGCADLRFNWHKRSQQSGRCQAGHQRLGTQRSPSSSWAIRSQKQPTTRGLAPRLHYPPQAGASGGLG